MRSFLSLLIASFLLACSQEYKRNDNHLFISQDAETTGITFENSLTYTEEFNPYTYRNFYNGAGVAIGDINNDGLDDIYFAGNQVDNKLYLNKGDFKFQDISASAGVSCPNVWCTGVTMADINADGWLDIYVCKSGAPGTGVRHNELFINNGDLTFKEQSKEYGLDLTGLSTHAAFFDYDNDGDLDAYIISNSLRSIGAFDLVKDQRNIPDDSNQGTKLLRNDNSKFSDVTIASGIYSSKIGFGLGVTVGDINQDGWLDMFVSNDFFERDYLYINNKNGTFSERAEQFFRSLSLGSMGADFADINNDNYPDLLVTEMLPDRADRYKTKANFETWDKQQISAMKGYYYQYPRNMLQINTGMNNFSETGRLAGIEATDWSWGALMADFDGDGLKDVFIANGIGKDLLDQDYVNFMADPSTIREILKKKGSVLKEIVDRIPSEPLLNYFFKNEGNLSFSNVSEQWGMSEPSFSNGSAYGDLDNDGDLDLVVSAIDQPCFVYRNQSSEKGVNYLKIVLTGKSPNRFAIGAKIKVYSDHQSQYLELIPTRGFMSSVSYAMIVGLGNSSQADSLEVIWPDGAITKKQNIPANQVLHLRQEESLISPKNNERPNTLFKLTDLPGYKEEENDFSDFDRDRLLYIMISNEGPKMCKGDINADGLDDFYIGGSSGEAGSLFVQQRSGSFKKSNQAIFEKDKIAEDCGCEFFDADKDGDQDLYVTSGGNEFPSSSTALLDRLYMNNGNGIFNKNDQLLPTSQFESTSVVRANDFDKDGDMDIFVGGRLRPFSYGVPTNSYILSNDSKGNFSDVSNSIAPMLKSIGMVTDAVWGDIDGDHDDDLIVVGDWLAIRVLENEKGVFQDKTDQYGLATTSGWWNRIAAADLDKDGDIDFVVGNHGTNSRFKASVERPIHMWVNDFDQNGSIEHILCRWWGDKEYPLALRNDLISQIPSLKKKYLKYSSYKDQGVADIFTPEQLSHSLKLEARELQSVILYNEGKKFRIEPLPIEAQLSPVYAIAISDYDRDGINDIMLGGNQYRVKPEIGRYDASYGSLFRGLSSGGFQFVKPSESGLSIKGEIRDIVNIECGNKPVVLVSVNSDSLKIVSFRK